MKMNIFELNIHIIKKKKLKEFLENQNLKKEKTVAKNLKHY